MSKPTARKIRIKEAGVGVQRSTVAERAIVRLGKSLQVLHNVPYVLSADAAVVSAHDAPPLTRNSLYITAVDTAA